MKSIETEFIMAEPQQYLNVQSKTFKQRLSGISLSEDQEHEIVKNQTVKTVRDKVLGLFKTGEVISTILKWNDTIDKELNEAKKTILLDQYFEKLDNQQSALCNLQLFLTNPQGNTLFNKILRILDDTPPDQELIKHLSSALTYMISKGDFYKMFESHKFALSQIENLTPQALTILADHTNYPEFQLGTLISTGSKITSEWDDAFVRAYSIQKNLKSQNYLPRISHVIKQLQTQGYIEAYQTNHKLCCCKITNIGKELLPYITI